MNFGDKKKKLIFSLQLTDRIILMTKENLHIKNYFYFEKVF